MLVAFLVMLPRWRGNTPRTYDPAMVLLLVYICVEYARPQSMYPQLDIIPWAKITMAGVLVGLFLKYRSGGIQAPLARRQDTLLFAYVGVAAISIWTGVDAESAIDPFLNLLKMVVFYFVLTRVLDTEARLGVFIWTLLILNLKLAQHHIRGFAGEVEHIGIENAIERGANVGVGFFANSGDFGIAMCVVLPLAFFAVWWERHRLLKWLAASSVVTFAVAIYATGTRGAFLGALAVGAVIWLKMPRKIPALAVAIAIGVIALSLAPDAYWTRMGTILTSREDQDKTATLRLDLWKVGLAMSAEYPVAGVGIGNFRVALRRQLDSRNWNYPVPPERLWDRGGRFFAPHNMFVQALSELGIPGLAVILFSFLVAFHRHREVQSVSAGSQNGELFPLYLSHGLDAALVGLAVSGSFLTVLYYPHLWLLLGLSVASTNVALIRAKEVQELDESDGEETKVVLSKVR